MIGTQILSYRIEKLIGEGGMGNVYLGVHTHIGRKVAIKALNPTLAKNPEIRERFKNEASMLSQLHHPNIVQLYDYVELDNGVYLVMEYAEGQALDEYIEKVTGPIPEEKAIPLFTQILDGVAYAHKKNVVHRDIKPSNIIVSAEGKVKILDFGIAKIIGDTSHKLTKTGTKLGTVLYMSPEQVKGQELDYRTDIYSLGITLFEMLTGKCPFDGSSTEYEVYKKIVEEPLADARSFYPAVSERLSGIIHKATDKNLNARFQSCQEFKQYILGTQNLDQAQGPVEKPDKQVRKKKPELKKEPKARRRKSMLFWNVFMGSLILTVMVIAGLKIMFQTDELYVIAGKLYLRNSRDATDDSNALKILNFGEKLEVLEMDTESRDDGMYWAKVRDESGKEGYVATNYLGDYDEYMQIKGIFTDESQARTIVMFKRAIREYFSDKGYFSNGVPQWRIYGESAKSEYNYFASGDFNTDGMEDYACVISHIGGEVYRLLVFLGKPEGKSELVLDEEIFDESLLRIMKKGEKISTGKTKYSLEYDADGNLVEVPKKVYESLDSDALVVKQKSNGKRRLYIFSIPDNAFNQPIDMK
jgi:serine/threonine protein kinase